MSTFNLSADAPVFVPSFAVAAAAPAEAVAGPAQPPADPAKRLTIDVLGGPKPKRTLTMRPMAEPRTVELEEPFDNIGVVYHGYGHGHGGDAEDPESETDSLASNDEGVEVGCHDNDYRLKKILRPIPGVGALDAGTFPKNIQEYYWINDGKNDEHPWYALGRLATGAYFYFTASCNFSGFDCEGQMALYLAPDLQTLYDNGMSGAARLRFASCFDKGTREKLKADAAAAKAARVAAAKARQAAKKPYAGAGGGGAAAGAGYKGRR